MVYSLVSGGSIVSPVGIYEPNKILIPCRHRSIPRLLSNSPTERVLHQHSNMDYIARDLHDVLLRSYTIPLPRTPILTSSSGPDIRNYVRQLRPTLDPHPRHNPPRLRSNDGLPLNRLLPIHPGPRNLQPNRRKCHLQRLRQLRQHLVR